MTALLTTILFAIGSLLGAFILGIKLERKYGPHKQALIDANNSIAGQERYIRYLARHITTLTKGGCVAIYPSDDRLTDD